MTGLDRDGRVLEVEVEAEEGAKDLEEAGGGAQDLAPLKPPPPSPPLAAEAAEKFPSAESELFFSVVASLHGSPAGHSCHSRPGQGEERLLVPHSCFQHYFNLKATYGFLVLLLLLLLTFTPR